VAFPATPTPLHLLHKATTPGAVLYKRLCPAASGRAVIVQALSKGRREGRWEKDEEETKDGGECEGRELRASPLSGHAVCAVHVVLVDAERGSLDATLSHEVLLVLAPPLACCAHLLRLVEAIANLYWS